VGELPLALALELVLPNLLKVDDPPDLRLVSTDDTGLSLDIVGE
jgi:hypothetical protein